MKFVKMLQALPVKPPLLVVPSHQTSQPLELQVGEALSAWEPTPIVVHVHSKSGYVPKKTIDSLKLAVKSLLPQVKFVVMQKFEGPEV